MEATGSVGCRERKALEELHLAADMRGGSRRGIGTGDTGVEANMEVIKVSSIKKRTRGWEERDQRGVGQCKDLHEGR